MIERIIGERAEEWRGSVAKRVSDSVRYRHSLYLSKVPDMKAVMSNPVLRRNEFAEGAKEIQRIASHLIRCTVVTREGKISVIPSLARRLAETTAWGGIGPQDLIEASGIGTYEVPDPADADVMTVYRLLSYADMSTPYDYVNRMRTIQSMGFDFDPLTQDSSADAFFAATDQIYARRERFSQAVPANGELYSMIAVRLHGVRTSKTLADMNSYGRVMARLEPVMRTMDLDSGTFFDSAYIDGLLSAMLRDGAGDARLAVAVLERYCYVRGYPADFSGGRSRVEICPSCGGMTPVGDGLSVC